MPHLILVRHGQSEWNLEKRFTGWVDVDLTGQGKLEACKSGEYVKELKLNIDYFYSSFQLRAVNTLKFIQDTLRDNKKRYEIRILIFFVFLYTNIPRVEKRVKA